jgi:DNA replication protein DnaC
VREFPKLAEQCAKEGATFEQFLLRLVEQEMLDRERRATERRIKGAKFPLLKSLETYDFLAIPSLNKKRGTGTLRVDQPPRQRARFGQ